jgi:trehalose/maltose hydrolase-like predicted phosphorylase
MHDTWTLTEHGFDPAQNLAWEGLCTQGSGYLHVRGSLEEATVALHNLSDMPIDVGCHAELHRIPPGVTHTVKL